MHLNNDTTYLNRVLLNSPPRFPLCLASGNSLWWRNKGTQFAQYCHTYFWLVTTYFCFFLLWHQYQFLSFIRSCLHSRNTCQKDSFLLQANDKSKLPGIRGDVIPPSLGNRQVGGDGWLGIDFVTADSFVNCRGSCLVGFFHCSRVDKWDLAFPIGLS